MARKSLRWGCSPVGALETDSYHISAMPAETLAHLDPAPGKVVVDGTLGGCGHALAIARQILPGGHLIGIDRDPDAIRNAHQVLAPFGSGVSIFHNNFKEINAVLDQAGIALVDAVLVDLGVSQHQIFNSGRGFSFQSDETLDMRMDPATAETAADIVQNTPERELADLFYRFGEERHARRIARRIAAVRRLEPIVSTGQLVRIVQAATAASGHGKFHRIHPATRVFQALRIAVNGELTGLETFIENAVSVLRPGGRLVVLAFHSLEDRSVKQTFRKLAQSCTCPPKLPCCVCRAKARVKLLTPKAVRPSLAEQTRNPMARSTRLRAVEKCRRDETP